MPRKIYVVDLTLEEYIGKPPQSHRFLRTVRLRGNQGKTLMMGLLVNRPFDLWNRSQAHSSFWECLKRSLTFKRQKMTVLTLYI